MKFKYLKHCRFYFDDEFEDFQIVENPLPYKNLPDGEYVIRGTQKNHRTEYWKFKNIWYLVRNITTDDGYKSVDCVKYKLIPNLRECDWENMKNVGLKKLKPIWQLYYQAYLHELELKKTLINISKFRKQICKN